MGKMNMQAVASKVGGVAAGTVASGMINKYLRQANVNPLYSAAGLVLAGVYLPQMVGDKGYGFKNHLGDAMIASGVSYFLREKFPNFIAGPEDEVSGPYDDSLSGYPTSDEVIVSGPYTTEDSVSGVGSFVN